MGEVLSCCASREPQPGGTTRRRRGDKHSTLTEEQHSKRLDDATKESGELTKEDKELLKALLKDLVAPDDVVVKVESTDGKAMHITLDMKNRLFVELAGAKTRRFPFNSIRNVSYGEKAGRHCFQVDFEVPLPGESGTTAYFLTEDSKYTAQQMAVEIREIIDTVSQDSYPLANFGVLKINPQGKQQARLLQLDLPNRLLSNVHKGDIKSQFHFSEISEVQDQPESPNFTLFFRDYRPYEFVCQTVEDKAVLLKVFRSISIGSYTVANLTHEDLSVIPFWPAFAVFSGPMDKKGELGWDKRHVVLTRTRIFVFRQKGSRNPLNVITLLGTTVEKGSADDEIKLTMTERDFRFRAPSKTARDTWYGHITRTIDMAHGNFKKYLNQTIVRAATGADGHAGKVQHKGKTVDVMGGVDGSEEGHARKRRSSSRGRSGDGSAARTRSRSRGHGNNSS